MPLAMIIHKRHCGLKLNGSLGFSLPELLVVIVIIGIISAVGIPAFFFLVRRERVNSVALEVAGWVELVRNAAADEISVAGNPNTEGCEITFETPLTALGPSALIASADCDLPEDELRTPADSQEPIDIAFPSVQPPIIFTPRGIWIVDDEDSLPNVDFEIVIELNGNRPLRCVRLSRVLGSVEIGRPDTFLGDDCTIWRTL